MASSHTGLQRFSVGFGSSSGPATAAADRKRAADANWPLALVMTVGKIPNGFLRAGTITINESAATSVVLDF